MRFNVIIWYIHLYMYCVQNIRVANKSILIILWKWCICVCTYTKYLDYIKSFHFLKLSPKYPSQSFPFSCPAFMNFKPFHLFNFFWKSLLAWQLYILLRHYMKLHTCILIEVTHTDNWQQSPITECHIKHGEIQVIMTFKSHSFWLVLTVLEGAKHNAWEEQ